MHPLVKLARDAVDEYVRHRRMIEPPADLTPEMKERAGVFVSLKKFGELRGCIGTFSPVTDSVAMEIIKNALSSATQDPRFNPVSADELDKLTFSVDILSEPQRVTHISQLDHINYGVIVSDGYHRGLLLPDLEGVNSVDEQLKIAKLKAGINPDKKDVEIYRFRVRRFR